MRDVFRIVPPRGRIPVTSLGPEFAELALDQPAPAVQDADDLVAAVEEPAAPPPG